MRPGAERFKREMGEGSQTGELDLGSAARPRRVSPKGPKSPSPNASAERRGPSPEPRQGLSCCAMETSLRRTLLLAATLACTGVAALAQGGAQTKQVPERGADLLSVDFVAVTSEGHPIADLRPDEITLRVGGKRRAVRSLQLISSADDGDRSFSDRQSP